MNVFIIIYKLNKFIKSLITLFIDQARHSHTIHHLTVHLKTEVARMSFF
jgi:hypothetical protein